MAVSAVMRAGRRAEGRAVREAYLEAGRARRPVRGSPEQTRGRRAVQALIRAGRMFNITSLDQSKDGAKICRHYFTRLFSKNGIENNEMHC